MAWSIIPRLLNDGEKKRTALVRMLIEKGHPSSKSTLTSTLSKLATGNADTVRVEIIDNPDRRRVLLDVLGVPELEADVLDEAKKLVEHPYAWVLVKDYCLEEEGTKYRDELREMVQALENRLRASSITDKRIGLLLSRPGDRVLPVVSRQLEGISKTLSSDSSLLATAGVVVNGDGEKSLNASRSGSGWEFSPFERAQTLIPVQGGNWSEEELSEHFPDEPLVACRQFEDPYASVEGKLGEILRKANEILQELDETAAYRVFQEGMCDLRGRERRAPYMRESLDCGPEGNWGYRNEDPRGHDPFVPSFDGIDRKSALVFLAMTGRLGGRIPFRIAAVVNDPEFDLADVVSIRSLSELGQELQEIPELRADGARLVRRLNEKKWPSAETMKQYYPHFNSEHPRYDREAELPIFTVSTEGRLFAFVGAKIEAPGEWVRTGGENEQKPDAANDNKTFSSPRGWKVESFPLNFDAGPFVARVGNVLLHKSPVSTPEFIRELEGETPFVFVSLGDVVAKLFQLADLWAGHDWSSAGEWKKREELWRDKSNAADDPLETVARRMLEGLFATFRPAHAPLTKRIQTKPRSPSQCFAKLGPALKRLGSAALAADVPPTVGVILDSISDSTAWRFREGYANESWDFTLMSAGGELVHGTLYEVPSWLKFHGEVSQARQHPEATLDWRLKPWTQGYPTVEGRVLRAHERHVGELALGNLRLRIRDVRSCPPRIGHGLHDLLTRHAAAAAEAIDDDDDYRRRMLDDSYDD